MDLPPLLCLNRTGIVYRLAEQIEDTAERLFADRNRNRASSVERGRAAGQTISGVHCNAACNIVTDVLCDLRNNGRAVVVYLECVEEVWKLSVCKFYIQYRANDLNHSTKVLLLVHAHNLLLL